MVNTGELAGLIYNALQEHRIRVYRVRYFDLGCWQICVMAKGGLIRGVPVVEYDGPTRCIRAAIRSLFGRRASASFEIHEGDTAHEIVEKVCVLVMERLP